MDVSALKPVESPEEYDEMLKMWTVLMDKEDYDGAWALLNRTMEHVEGLPPLEVRTQLNLASACLITHAVNFLCWSRILTRRVSHVSNLECSAGDFST